MKVSPGLKKVLQKYCVYRKWESASKETLISLRELIERAGTVEEVMDGLWWFFEYKRADQYIIDKRPNLAINFLITCWHLYEIYANTTKIVRTDSFNEYRYLK